jgi:ATP-dependent DNA helicase DinG
MQITFEAAAREVAPQETDEAVDPQARRTAAALHDLADTTEALTATGPHLALHVLRTGAGQPGRLRVSPLRIGDQLRDGLLKETPVIATSATLAVDGAFEHVARQLGFVGGDDKSWDALDVGSPFDYPRQAQLYVGADLPEPREREQWEAAVDERIVHLIKAAGGRCLALFSSRAAAQRAASRIRAELDVPVLLQGDDTDARLVWRFASDAKTCLFATRGFWHGVDVPGSACQLVIIDRLPFTYVDNPLHKARVERLAGLLRGRGPRSSHGAGSGGRPAHPG